MSATFIVWLIISTWLVRTNCVLRIHEPNVPKVNGTSNEYHWIYRVEFGFENPELILVCDGPVLMRWKLSGLMNLTSTIDVSFYSGEYKASFRLRDPNSLSTGFFTCEANEEKHRQSHPAVSIYIYVDSPLDGFDLIGKRTGLDMFDATILDYIQVQDTIEYKKSKCVKLLIPCRLSNPNLNVTLAGKTYVNQTQLFPDATYDGKRGFTLTYCNNTIKVFVCRTMEKEVEYAWKPLLLQFQKDKERMVSDVGRYKETFSNFFAFHSEPFNLSCAGDSSMKFSGKYINLSEVFVKKIFPHEDVLIHTATLKIVGPEIGISYVECMDSDTKHTFIIDNYGRQDVYDKSWSYNSVCKMYTCFSEDTDGSSKLSNRPCLNEVDCELKKEHLKKGQDFWLSKHSNANEVKLGAQIDWGRIITLDPFPAGIFYCRNSFWGYMNKYFTGVDGILYFMDHDKIPETAVITFNFNNSPFYLGLDTQMGIDIKYSTYLLAPWATIFVRNGSGTEVIERISPSQGFKNLSLVDRYLTNPSHAYTMNTFLWNFSPRSGMIELIICVQMLNETGQRNFSSKLDMHVGTIPKITNSKYNFDYHHGESGSYDIKSSADGNPTPKISWRKISPQQTNLTAKTTQEVFKVLQDTLMFPAIVPEIAGQYECIAFNFRHNLNDSKIFTVSTRDRPFDWKILMWIFLSGILVLCLVVSICIYYKRREGNLANAVRHLTLKEVEDFFKGAALSTQPFFRQQVDAAENAVRMPYNDVFEVDPDDILYGDILNKLLESNLNVKHFHNLYPKDSSNLIGQGAFGMVFKANLRVGMKSVAVKTVHENVTTEVFKATLSELKILMYVGYHPHIVEFLGAITKDIEKLDVKLVLEYCDNGDMNKHLRNMHRNGLDLNRGSCSQNGTTKQFLKWLVGIAFGMEHLAKRKIIHGDLATRNILLNSNLDPKITDFGLSAKSADYSAYVRKGKNEPLPWRWMALESLTRFTFSSASDVWSFGVTAWEIFSFGGTPYPNRTWDESFVQNLCDGIRLQKPENCADEIFEKILSCWNENLKLRADIFSLKIKFQEILVNMP